MANVSKFIIEGETIDVYDETARTTANAANEQVRTLSTKVSHIENLSRLTVAYNESSSTITFTSNTHN